MAKDQREQQKIDAARELKENAERKAARDKAREERQQQDMIDECKAWVKLCGKLEGKIPCPVPPALAAKLNQAKAIREVLELVVM